MNRLICIAIFLLIGSPSSVYAQGDSLLFRDKHEISISSSFLTAKSYLNQLEEITLTSQESNYLGLNYRVGLVHRRQFNAKLSLGVDLWSIRQMTTYTYFVTDVTSSHSPNFKAMTINLAPQLNFKIIQTSNASFGLDLLPGAEINLLESSNPSVVHSDYTDPSLGFEVGRFVIENHPKIYSSLLIQFWSLIHLGNYGVKPFIGIKFSNPQTSVSFVYPNGNRISHNYHGVRPFLNLGIAVVLPNSNHEHYLQ